MDRIEEIQERADAASPGPWQPDTAVRGDCVVWGPNGRFLLNQQAEPHWLEYPGEKRSVAFDVDRRDCEFIAHAREDVPWLIERVTELEAKMAEAWEEGATFSRMVSITPITEVLAMNPYRSEP